MIRRVRGRVDIAERRVAPALMPQDPRRVDACVPLRTYTTFS
jgi:hypothetical protein